MTSICGSKSRPVEVQLVTGTGAMPVAESDVRLRFNNWDRIRAERIPALLGNGIVLGATGVLLLFAIVGWGPVKRVHPAE